jgi:hypothetical protein
MLSSTGLAAWFLCVVFPAALAIHQGPLLIEEDGKTVIVHVVAQSEKGTIFRPEGASLTMSWGGEVRGFLAATKMDDMPHDNYYNFTLFNKELSYDIDLGAVGCSCNSALFFVSMPGHNPDGTIAEGNLSMNPYYCDANQIGGVWCWEHDTIEGNMYNMATTPHNCDAAPGAHTTNCDKKGCQSSSFVTNPKSMCPEDDCIIDTRKQFRIIQSFEASADQTTVARIHNKIVQGDAIFEWDSCSKADYFQDMTAAFKANMTMVFQLWGDTWQTMDWLDKVTGCTGECDKDATTTTFSNIAIRSLAAAAAEDSVVVV